MRKLLILLLLFSSLIAVAGLYFYSNLQGVCQKNCQTQVFVVEKGATLNDVLEKLQKEKIIKNAWVAKIYLKLTGFKGNIQVGDFKLNPQNNLIGVISALQKGTLDFWVTIPEGYRAEQIYEKIQEARTSVIPAPSLVIPVSPSVIPVSPSVIPAKAGIQAPSIYIQNEGYLFPDTYLIPRNANDEDVVKIMKNNFDTKIQAITHSDCRDVACNVSTMGNNSEKITLQNLIILASLVEREAKNDSERPIIANIIYKRFKADWPLQVDATIQFIVGKSGEWWKKDLTFDDLKIDSPYNTYLNKGLPPGPICNPGEKAILAVINQTQTDYWFYATGDDGVTRFSKTLGEHNQNVDKNIKN